MWGKSEGAENKAVKLTLYLKRLPPRWVAIFSAILLSYGALPDVFPLLLPFLLIALLRESLSYMAFLVVFLLAVGSWLSAYVESAYAVALSWSLILSLLYLSLAFSPSTLSLIGLLGAASLHHYHPLLTPLAWVLGGAFFLFFSSLLNKPSTLFLGMPLPKLLTAFMKSWLLHTKDLERALEKLSTKTEVEVFVLDIEDATDKLEVVIPNLHFGPFGELGSGAFPAMVAKARNAVVFHGTANHQLDLVDREEAKGVVKALAGGKEVGRSERGAWKVGKAGRAKAWLLDGGSVRIAFLSRSPFVTEDITYGGGLKLRLETEAIPVDLHNSSADTITYFDEFSREVEEYEKAVKSAKGRGGPYYFAYAFLPSKSPAVGGAGIRLLALKAGTPLFFVVVDSNGIRKECREALEQWGREKGMEVVVATTDTHEKNIKEGVINDYGCEDAEEIKAALLHLKEELEKKEKANLRATLRLRRVTAPARVVGSRKVVESLNVILDSYAIARSLLPFLLFIDALLLHVASMLY